jgi:hypothetical protein
MAANALLTWVETEERWKAEEQLLAELDLRKFRSERRHVLHRML